jgi:hypothetical protein
MGVGLELGDGHECRGCWQLQEPSLENELEEIVAHEDPRGRFIAITDARGNDERYPTAAPMTKVYLEARGLDWR